MTFTNDKCNNPDCGKRILWSHPYTGQKIIHPETGNTRPLNPDGTLHKCMFKGQRTFFKKRKIGNRITDYH